jgi:hypothetical protein
VHKWQTVYKQQLNCGYQQHNQCTVHVADYVDVACCAKVAGCAEVAGRSDVAGCAEVLGCAHWAAVILWTAEGTGMLFFSGTLCLSSRVC